MHPAQLGLKINGVSCASATRTKFTKPNFTNEINVIEPPCGLLSLSLVWLIFVLKIPVVVYSAAVIQTQLAQNQTVIN